jgi:hypothetical protein
LGVPLVTKDSAEGSINHFWLTLEHLQEGAVDIQEHAGDFLLCIRYAYLLQQIGNLMFVKVFSRPAGVYQANQRLHGAPLIVSFGVTILSFPR